MLSELCVDDSKVVVEIGDVSFLRDKKCNAKFIVVAGILSIIVPVETV
jgi:hypothetical protein